MKAISPGFAVALVLFAALPLAADDRVDALSEDHRAWLTEEVIYIISPDEREVFLNLQTKEEQDLFMEAFWDRRDPNPATLENEFAKEHYRRLEHAMRVLGREAPRAGWKTDRGKHYIILGEPAEVQRYYGNNEVVEMELWLYNGEWEYGLPARFNLLFFRENNIGEYQLYHPHADGPEALINDGFNLRTNQNQALDLLETVSVDVAKASLTVDLSEPTASMFQGRNTRDPTMLQVRPSMSVDRNFADIQEFPLKKVDTDYLQGYLDYGNRVTADYSFNFVDSRSIFSVLVGPGNTPFVHYSIELEPQNLSLEANDDETEFYTTLQVGLELRNMEGQLLAMTDNEPFVRLTKSQFDVAGAFPFAYRDSFPVLPGDYQVSVVLRNRATKEYTVAESVVSIPQPSDALGVTDLILAAGFDDVAAVAAGEHKTFQLAGVELDPVAQPVYALDSVAYVATQVLNGTVDQKMRFSVLADGEVVASEEAPVRVASDGLVIGEVPLLSIPAGNYAVRGELIAPDGEVLVTREAELQISPRTTIDRAGAVYRHSFRADWPGLLDVTLGDQLMARGELNEAETRYRRAMTDAGEQLPMARWKLASTVLFQRRADEALELLTPLETAHPDQVEVVEGLGFAHYINNAYDVALPYLDKAKSLRPPDTSLLNAIGDCYEQLKQPVKARETFELSLQLNPEQKGVKARLAGLSDG